MTVEVPALVHLGQCLRAAGYRFITPTPLTHARVNARPQNAWARDLADIFGWSRKFREEIVPPAILRALDAAGVRAPCDEGWRSTVRASTLDEQLFFHSAFPTTARDAVFFGPDTYKFTDAIRHWLEPGRTVRRAADIFTGGGPGAIVVARRKPEAEVWAVDINPTALACCAANAALAGVANVRPTNSNLLADTPGRFDLITAHPPYLIDRNARTYRHGGGPLGAALSLATVREAATRLEPGGTLLLFTGVAIENGHDAFRDEAMSHLDPARFAVSCREVDPDVFGEELEHPPYDTIDRIALVVLEARHI